SASTAAAAPARRGPARSAAGSAARRWAAGSRRSSAATPSARCRRNGGRRFSAPPSLRPPPHPSAGLALHALEPMPHALPQQPHRPLGPAEGFRPGRPTLATARSGHLSGGVAALRLVVLDPVGALAQGDQGEQAPQPVPAADLERPVAVA